MEQPTLDTQRTFNGNSVRAGMRNSEIGLSFVVLPNASGGRVGVGGGSGDCRSARSSVLRESQGECCWRLHSSHSLRYRLLGDLLCAATILPGSLAVIVLTVTYLSGEPNPHEPFPWLKYVMAGLGCLLLALCLVWLLTAVCVYRRALARRRSPAFKVAQAAEDSTLQLQQQQIAITVTPPTGESHRSTVSRV